MEREKICRCLDIGVTAGVLSEPEAAEAKEFFLNNGDEKLTRHEAAKYLKICPETVDKKVRQGFLPRFRTAVGPRFLKSDLDKILTTSRQARTA